MTKSMHASAVPRLTAGKPRSNKRRGVGAIPVAALFKPVDAASLAFFRIAFGAIMVWEVFRYFAADRIERSYIDPQFLFSYFGFGWIQPWPGNGMYIHFGVLGVVSMLMSVGLFYRVSAALFFVGFTYVFLLDQARYLNHFYLVCLISFLLVFIPAHTEWSLDARRRPILRSGNVPGWALWLLRAQIACVYFFGGIAKLNRDWLQGEPVRSWLRERTYLPMVGGLMDEEWLVWVFAYGGLLFDLLVVPALLWRRTRPWAFTLAICFHLTNAFVFNIGVFPWLMLAATTLFFKPDWPRRLFHRSQVAPRSGSQPGKPRHLSRGPVSRIVWAIAIYLTIQLLLPLRHWLYPGNVNWTEEGHRFSWRMKLRDKEGETRFFVTDPAGGMTRPIEPQHYLQPAQVQEMSTRPDMILQFAHYLAAEARRSGASNAQVRAMAKVSLNGRAPQLLIDPSIDLAREPRSLLPSRWILPLNEPLRRRQASAETLP